MIIYTLLSDKTNSIIEIADSASGQMTGVIQFGTKFIRNFAIPLSGKHIYVALPYDQRIEQVDAFTGTVVQSFSISFPSNCLYAVVGVLHSPCAGAAPTKKPKLNTPLLQLLHSIIASPCGKRHISKRRILAGR